MHIFSPKIHYFDILIIGAGGAGLMASLLASQKGYSVGVLSKVHPTKSHTVAAQGGINAALGNVEPDDWRWHMHDTIKGSDFLADQDAVEFMCSNAADTVLQLNELGVQFSKLPNGKIYQRMYGGQSTNFGQGKLAYRACAANDQTGSAIINALYHHTLKSNVAFFNYYLAYELLFKEGACIGAASWSMADGELHVFIANQTILATGGYGQIYQTTTTANICTGDGNALCANAGLTLQDMEFVQFHPTALPHTGILITEAARAEGGYLLNNAKERFMQNYSPDFMELACRDVVARAIATEIAQNKGSGPNKDYVFLDLTHLPKDIIESRLPGLKEITKQFAHCDIFKEYIPVAPAAHYTMGGIPTNLNAEVMPGLMAIGETACVSVHGANRLGCNSLLDIIVFAKSAINQCSKLINPKQKKPEYNFQDHFIKQLISSNTGQQANEIKNELKKIMQKSVGMFRNSQTLQDGLTQLKNLTQFNLKIDDKILIWNNQLLEAIETRFLLTQSLITCFAALKREESRGAHYRTDFPQKDDKNWLKHSLVTIDQNFNLTYNTKAVNVTPAKTNPIF